MRCVALSCGAVRASFPNSCAITFSCLSHLSAVGILFGLLECPLEKLLGCESSRCDPCRELARSYNGVGTGGGADGSLAHDKRPDKDGYGDETGEIQGGVDGLDDDGGVLVVDAWYEQGCQGEVGD
jgi:hypothetical protein